MILVDQVVWTLLHKAKGTVWKSWNFVESAKIIEIKALFVCVGIHISVFSYID
jgi:hypothetical protein